MSDESDNEYGTKSTHSPKWRSQSKFWTLWVRSLDNIIIY